MNAVCRWGLHFGLVLAAALFAPSGSTTAFAYTQDQQAACMGDAFQFCGPEIPDVARVTACMIRNKARLSPDCRAQFRSGPAPRRSAGKAKKPKKPARPATT